MKPKSMRYIARVESGHNKCYAVRAGFFEGSSFKTFTDGIYGGKRKALAAAKLWRDQEVLKFQEKIGKKNPRREYGKGWYMKRHERRGVISFSATAQWFNDKLGKQRQKSFSVNKYGRKEAIRLAKQHYKLVTTGEL